IKDPNFALSGTLSLAINNTGQAIDETFNLDGETTTLKLGAGRYIRVEGTDISFTARVDDQNYARLTGSVAFEQVTIGTGPTAQKVMRIAVVDAGADVVIGGKAAIHVTGGEGGFIFYGPASTSPPGTPGTYAGSLKVTVAAGVEIPGVPVSVTGDVLVKLNNTGHAVNEVIALNGKTLRIDVPEGDIV